MLGLEPESMLVPWSRRCLGVDACALESMMLVVDELPPLSAADSFKDRLLPSFKDR